MGRFHRGTGSVVGGDSRVTKGPAVQSDGGDGERGWIITSAPVRGVTFPLMQWSETSNHAKS